MVKVLDWEQGDPGSYPALGIEASWVTLGSQDLINIRLSNKLASKKHTQNQNQNHCHIMHWWLYYSKLEIY